MSTFVWVSAVILWVAVGGLLLFALWYLLGYLWDSSIGYCIRDWWFIIKLCIYSKQKLHRLRYTSSTHYWNAWIVHRKNRKHRTCLVRYIVARRLRRDLLKFYIRRKHE